MLEDIAQMELDGATRNEKVPGFRADGCCYDKFLTTAAVQQNYVGRKYYQVTTEANRKTCWRFVQPHGCDVPSPGRIDGLHSACMRTVSVL